VRVRLRSSAVDAGTVTAELAMTLPGVVLVAMALLVTGQAAIGEVRCTDAARAGARLAARGDSDAAVVAEVGRLAPTGSRVVVSHNGSRVLVSVSSALGAPAPSWARLDLHVSATADVEGADP
jgi:hypothetical protein